MSAVRAVVEVCGVAAAALAAAISRGDQLILHDRVKARVGEIEARDAFDALSGAAFLLFELLLAFSVAQVAIVYKVATIVSNNNLIYNIIYLYNRSE